MLLQKRDMRDYLLDTLAYVAGLPIPDHCKSQLRNHESYAKFFKPLPNEPNAAGDLSWMAGWSKAETEVMLFVEAAFGYIK